MYATIANSLRNGPSERGRFFGDYGGRFVAETHDAADPLEVEQAYNAAKSDPAFHADLQYHLTHYVGRPSPLWFARRLTERLGRAKIYFKRDVRTEPHRVAQSQQLHGADFAGPPHGRGRQRIIAETGAGQHGVATATMCALFGLKCVVYMGATDVERQKPNVFRMKLLGAEVVSVTSGAGTLKDAMNEAMRSDWVANASRTPII